MDQQLHQLQHQGMVGGDGAMTLQHLGRWLRDRAPVMHQFGIDGSQAGIATDAPYTLFASEQFNLQAVDRPICLAFSNSLFSHLSLNSIVTCLLRVKEVLEPNGAYYSTFFAADPQRPWLDPQPRDKWGHGFSTYPHQDPYHYPPALLKAVAAQAGFQMDLLRDFGHPTQTMARFRPRRRWW